MFYYAPRYRRDYICALGRARTASRKAFPWIEENPRFVPRVRGRGSLGNLRDPRREPVVAERTICDRTVSRARARADVARRICTVYLPAHAAATSIAHTMLNESSVYDEYRTNCYAPTNSLIRDHDSRHPVSATPSYGRYVAPRVFMPGATRIMRCFSLLLFSPLPLPFVYPSIFLRR